jgi:hypothetical protein
LIEPLTPQRQPSSRNDLLEEEHNERKKANWKIIADLQHTQFGPTAIGTSQIAKICTKVNTEKARMGFKCSNQLDVASEIQKMESCHPTVIRHNFMSNH